MPDSRPVEVVVFEVNETLSDMSVMAQRFADVGADGRLAPTWFAGLLRDGIALAATGSSEQFATIARAWVSRGGGRYPAYFRAPDRTATGIDDLAGQLTDRT